MVWASGIVRGNTSHEETRCSNCKARVAVVTRAAGGVGPKSMRCSRLSATNGWPRHPQRRPPAGPLARRPARRCFAAGHRGDVSGRPGASDSAICGHLTQLAQLDPTPMALAAEIAPRMCARVRMIEDLGGLEPTDADWFDVSHLPASLHKLLRETGRTYAPLLLANAQALSASEAELQATIDGPLPTRQSAWLGCGATTEPCRPKRGALRCGAGGQQLRSAVQHCSDLTKTATPHSDGISSAKFALVPGEDVLDDSGPGRKAPGLLQRRAAVRQRRREGHVIGMPAQQR